MKSSVNTLLLDVVHPNDHLGGSALPRYEAASMSSRSSLGTRRK